MKDLIEKTLEEIKTSQEDSEVIIKRVIHENNLSGFHKLTFLAQLQEKL